MIHDDLIDDPALLNAFVEAGPWTFRVHVAYPRTYQSSRVAITVLAVLGAILVWTGVALSFGVVPTLMILVGATCAGTAGHLARVGPLYTRRVR